MGVREIRIDLDANTDYEVTTDEEKEVTVKSTTDEPKAKVKKCFVGYQKMKPLYKKSSDSTDCRSYFVEDFDDTKHNKIKSDSNKVNKTDHKTKILDNSLDLRSLPSTSTKHLPNESIGPHLAKSCDNKMQRSVQMKDQSTDSRYYYCPSNSSSKIEDNSSISRQMKASTATSTTPQIVYTYICHNCNQRFDTKKDFSIHFDEIHSNTDLVKRFQKIETLELKEPIFVTTSQQKEEKKCLPSPPPLPTHHSSHINSKEPKNVLKWKKRKAPPPSPVMAQNHSLKYRVVQKCTICTFTPLVNSLEAIKEHITNEHKYNDNIDRYYRDVIVKICPKNT